jgi:hypothetical protein
MQFFFSFGHFGHLTCFPGGSFRAKETCAQVVVDFDGRAAPSRTARRNERSIVRLSAFGAAVMEKVVECSVVKHPALRS